jgi:hypothetical protein
LPQVIDEIPELIEMGIITTGSLSSGMYMDFQIFLVNWSFPGVSLLWIAFLGR